MKFEDKFKPGDIIRRGKPPRTLMIVKELRSFEDSLFSRAYSYTCEDLFVDRQRWMAYESGNFRLATDEDIVEALTSLIFKREEVESEFGDIEVDLKSSMITLCQNGDISLLDPKAAIELRDLINKYVEVR